MYSENHLAAKLQQASQADRTVDFIRSGAPDGSMSYGVFFDRAQQVANALVRAGVVPGSRVAIQAPKTVGMLELYVGTILAGGVFLPLNTAYTAPEVAYFLGDAEPTVFVCATDRLPELQRVAAEAGVSAVWTLDSDETGTLADHRDAEPAAFSAVPRSADDLAAILYTSGTTGRSKGAMLTHRALAANAEVLVDYWAFTSDDVLIHALPIFHTHGLFVATNTVMMSGSSMVFQPGFDAAAILQAMPSATVLMGVPTFYVRLLANPDLAQASAGMRLFVSGSAPLLAETHTQWQQVTGHAILERYGMTETNMNTSNPYNGERRAGTVGFPLPGVEVKICDPDTGKKVDGGSVGMLQVRGPNVFAGYWRMPEKTAEELQSDGFFITGDLAQTDEDGYIQIVGRNKDLIISGGFNVYPKEVELIIDGMPGVSESAVIGVPHPDFGEAVVAVVVPDGSAALEEDGVIAKLGDHLARFKQPKRVVFVDELPRNAMAKVQKNALRDQFHTLFAA